MEEESTWTARSWEEDGMWGNSMGRGDRWGAAELCRWVRRGERKVCWCLWLDVVEKLKTELVQEAVWQISFFHTDYS